MLEPAITTYNSVTALGEECNVDIMGVLLSEADVEIAWVHSVYVDNNGI